jgi:hypothetical protein
MAGWDAFQYLRWLRHLGKIMYLIVLAVVGVSWWAVMSSTHGDIAHGGMTGLITLLAVLAFNFMVRGLPPTDTPAVRCTATNMCSSVT